MRNRTYEFNDHGRIIIYPSLERTPVRRSGLLLKLVRKLLRADKQSGQDRR